MIHKLNKLSKKSSTFLLIMSFTFIAFSCQKGGDPDCADIVVDDNVIADQLEQYHGAFFPTELEVESKDKIGVYVDFSDGITNYCMKNENNKLIYNKFFTSSSNLSATMDFFELSNDAIIPFTGDNIIGYFQGDGFKAADGKFKIAAPIDKAIDAIVEKDNIGILITDGELALANNSVSKEMWASKALAKWFQKGHTLEIIYTDFDEINNGNTFRKHMYMMFFIPKDSKSKILDNFVSDLKSDSLEYKTLTFSTNITNLFEREYPNAQTPGASKYVESFEAPESYFSSEKMAIEFIDFSEAPFSLNEDGIVHYLRDLGDDNGKKKNFPLLEKLFFNFEKLDNYKVNKIKLVVHDVYDDFNGFKKHTLARNNAPKVLKNTQEKDSLTDENYLVFDCLTTIDGIEPYDIVNKTQKDTPNNFVSLLNNEFAYNKKTFGTNDKGVQDFLFLDQTAGEVNEVNDAGKYEIIIKFDKKLNADTKGLNRERQNMFRVDIVIEDAVLKDTFEDALTWDKIDNSGNDEALFTSLKNTMKENTPKGVIYSYYLKFGAFEK